MIPAALASPRSKRWKDYELGQLYPRLVVCQGEIDGYRRFSLMRASAVVKRQSTVIAAVLRSVSHAAASCSTSAWLGIRRSRHWRSKTDNTISALVNPLPWLGVQGISGFAARR